MIPKPEAIFKVLDATWPAARQFTHEGWTLREGAGGGQRVSAATADTATADLASAEAGMRTHLNEILKSLPKIHQRYPDYFVGTVGPETGPFLFQQEEIQ